MAFLIAFLLSKVATKLSFLLFKNSEISEAQNFTDKYISNIDKILEQKKSDIMKV